MSPSRLRAAPPFLRAGATILRLDAAIADHRSGPARLLNGLWAIFLAPASFFLDATALQLAASLAVAMGLLLAFRREHLPTRTATSCEGAQATDQELQWRDRPNCRCSRRVFPLAESAARKRDRLPGFHQDQRRRLSTVRPPTTGRAGCQTPRLRSGHSLLWQKPSNRPSVVCWPHRQSFAEADRQQAVAASSTTTLK